MDPAMEAAFKEIQDTLKKGKEPEVSFKLDRYCVGKMCPHFWWDRFEKYCTVKGYEEKEVFPLMADDVVSAWFKSLKNTDNLKDQFLEEFGDLKEKFWDRRAELQSMTQGSEPIKDYIRNVLAKARRVFRIKDTQDFDDNQKQELMTILMGGFNELIKTLVLLKSPETLNEMIKYAKEAKCLEQCSSATPILAAVRDQCESVNCQYQLFWV